MSYSIQSALFFTTIMLKCSLAAVFWCTFSASARRLTKSITMGDYVDCIWYLGIVGSLRPRLCLMATVKVDLSEQSSRRLIAGASSYESAALEAHFYSVPGDTIGIQIIPSFMQTRFQDSNCFILCRICQQKSCTLLKRFQQNDFGFELLWLRSFEAKKTHTTKTKQKDRLKKCITKEKCTKCSKVLSTGIIKFFNRKTMLWNDRACELLISSTELQERIWNHWM